MRPSHPFELPAEQQRALRRAKRLAWLTLAYLTSVVLLLFVVLGSSQAMKAAWLEDLLSVVPSLSFLVATRVASRPPSRRYPFGHQRATTIAYLCGALALLAMGAFLLFESVGKLLAAEHPVIGSVEVLGHSVWLGWLMLPALAWSGLPVVFLGRAKLPLARCLHDKVLHADAMMNKADWLTAAAAFLGVLGIGLGWWWADAVAASVISLDIAHDGVRHLRLAVGDLMDRYPRTADGKQRHELPRRLEYFLRDQPWVADAAVRMREEGHVFFADALVVPRRDGHLVDEIARTTAEALRLDWRLHDLVIMPVHRLPRDTDAPETGREGPHASPPPAHAAERRARRRWRTSAPRAAVGQGKGGASPGGAGPPEGSSPRR